MPPCGPGSKNIVGILLHKGVIFTNNIRKKKNSLVGRTLQFLPAVNLESLTVTAMTALAVTRRPCAPSFLAEALIWQQLLQWTLVRAGCFGGSGREMGLAEGMIANIILPCPPSCLPGLWGGGCPEYGLVLSREGERG